jgi:hypothetical protein
MKDMSTYLSIEEIWLKIRILRVADNNRRGSVICTRLLIADRYIPQAIAQRGNEYEDDDSTSTSLLSVHG